LERVMLYNVDDLRAQAEQNLKGRRGKIDGAGRIVERESATCLWPPCGTGDTPGHCSASSATPPRPPSAASWIGSSPPSPT
jgi:hypothetical protein